MEIAIPIYDGITVLDAIGPYEPLSRLPGAEIRFVGAEVIAGRVDAQRADLDPAPQLPFAFGGIHEHHAHFGRYGRFVAA